MENDKRIRRRLKSGTGIRGRPALEGRRVVVKLTEEQIVRAELIGGGNVAAGVRIAIERHGKRGVILANVSAVE